MIRVPHLVACPIKFNLLFDQGQQGRVFKVMKNDHFFYIFISFGHFPQVFAQVNEWPILELHEMIRVPHLVVFPIVFILFDVRDWQGGVLKLIKNDHFLVFSVVWVLLRSGLC